ncbi:MAG: polysaccharide pyruvyl transferase CsaB [Lachnospirales bacterium]
MSKQLKVTILGYHGYGNGGDEAILLALRNNIEKINSEAKITVLSFDPENTKKLYNVNAVPRFNMLSVAKELMKTDILVAGGGTLIQDETSTRSLFYYLSVIYIAKIFGKKVMLYSNGVGPINIEKNKKYIRFVVNKVDVVTLRDEYSKAELVALGIKESKLNVTADPAFSLTANKEIAESIFEKEKIAQDKPIIAVSLRKWDNDKEILDKVAKLCNHILENRDVNILIIPMQYSFDMNISRELYNKLDSERTFLLEKPYLAEEILAIISKTHMMISMRLHSLIFAGVLDVPLVGLVYDPKVRTYLELLDMESLGDVKGLDEQNMIDVTNKVLDNISDYKNRLNKSTSILKEKAKETDIFLEKLVNNIQRNS